MIGGYKHEKDSGSGTGPGDGSLRSERAGFLSFCRTSATEKEEELSLEIIDATEESQAVLDSFKLAYDAGDTLSVLPEEIKAQIPEGLGTINEMVTAHFVGETGAISGDYKATINFETPYEEGKEVAVLFGKLGGEEIEWTLLSGIANADGAIEVVIPAALIADLGNDPFILAVVSE